MRVDDVGSWHKAGILGAAAKLSLIGGLADPLGRVVLLAAFSDAHSAPAQRFYNLLCTAYGSDPTRYGDFVEKDYLPKSRAGSCKREYNTTAFAFRELISPHVDKELAKQILGKNWLPSSQGLDAGTGGRALQ
jgi:Putative metallopeptidase